MKSRLLKLFEFNNKFKLFKKYLQNCRIW